MPFDASQLLDDARLVVDYAIRVGRLPNDALPRALHAVESSAPETVSRELPALAAALNEASFAIAPMNLIELRAGRNPFNPRHRRIIRVLQGVFCFCTIALTVAVADQTEHLHRQETALKTLQRLQETHPLEKLNALRKMAEFNALNRQDSIHFDQFHRGISELRELQDQLVASYSLLNSAAGTHLLPQPATAGGYSRKDFETIAHLTNPDVAASPNPMDSMPPSDECDTRTARDSRPAADTWLQQVIVDLVEELCFARKINVLLELPPTSLIYEVQASMETLNSWVLPFLYGLLGAAVFVMRSLLDPRSPLIGFLPSIVRVALGGTAGIIIGWFWVPSVFAAGEITTVSSIPFGLAFLAGFSIDMLFSALDRVARTVSQPGST
jgi:hypothetical protein